MPALALRCRICETEVPATAVGSCTRCFGPLDPVYDRDAPFPGALLQMIDADVRPYAHTTRPAGRAYEFHWHGLMGYNRSGIRLVGAHPRHERLLYNLGCNGVGFLPSVFGGHRLARLLAGERLAPSLFDPR